MTSLKNLFNFLDDQNRIDHAGSGAVGLSAGGGVAFIIGLQTGNPMVGLVGLVLNLGTIALTTPVLAGSGGNFKPKTFVATAALALAAAFGAAAALPQLPAKAPVVASEAHGVAAPAAAPCVLSVNQKAPQAPRVTAAL